MVGSTRGCDPATQRQGTVENEIVSQLIIPTKVLPIYCQVVNTAISTVDEFEEKFAIAERLFTMEKKYEPYCSKFLYPLTPNPFQVSNGEDMQAAKRVKFQLSDTIYDKS